MSHALSLAAEKRISQRLSNGGALPGTKNKKLIIFFVYFKSRSQAKELGISFFPHFSLPDDRHELVRIQKI